MKIGDAVFVEWEDSYGCSSSWQDIPNEGEPQTMLCQSLGWLVRRSRKCVVIVPHLAENERMGIKQGCGDMTIPAASIVRITRLNVKK
ncbi:MAG: hypothetical protein JO295_13910 [Verrucomicrobia bacterium]|nr:hypothetical protein [Verrucomicrobiota bacterium]